MKEILIENAEVFAWTPADMLGVDRSLISHAIPTNGRMPVKQKKRNFEVERQKAIKEEIDRLLEAGFIREVY